jgi:tRNA (mo5U34)-methyltransferase
MAMFGSFYQTLAADKLQPWLQYLPARLAQWERDLSRSQQQNYLQVPRALPPISPSELELRQALRVGLPQDLAPGQEKMLLQLLQRLKPWRKGPLNLFGIEIETEWRSDWKWDRIRPHISPLADRRVLDVGCGNGYYLWRMRGEGAACVIGIDPMVIFLAQFLCCQHFIQDPAVHVLPLGVDDLPSLPLFDTVFSLGVLYHRRSPIDFLTQLHSQLRPGGELVLETLVVEGNEQTVLVPQDRYAQMRNVWFIPSVAALQRWLERVGFTEIALVNLNTTSLDEQRRTAWMEWESLADFLDPNDRSKTVEGYPAPLRAVLVAQKT